ncbi:hypothetical protein L3X38_036370 [Prunus dulcis]|uniref:DUF8040 domain-containing protein n=1 Tax=Prunus dulcis TaxID=3755 RepID=A0AAD4V2E6_PRUDU|nr:hypothetical protein L3X38_036370 [Prunus dulcis]
MAIQAVAHALNEFMIIMHSENVERPLTRRTVTRKGYNYIHNALSEDPEHFRQMYRMYPYVFHKLCSIIREKTQLQDIRLICVEEMLETFLRVVGQNNRFSVIRDTFGRSHFTTSISFNKVLKALNTLAPEILVKPEFAVPAKIRESTRVYPYFKNYIGAIDGTHIPAMVTGVDVSSYCNRHGTISQGKYFLVGCGFPNRRQFLAQFRGVRYHLQDFASQGRDPATWS